MLRVLADNSDAALSLDDLALFTDRFHRGTNLHFGILLSEYLFPMFGDTPKSGHEKNGILPGQIRQKLYNKKPSAVKRFFLRFFTDGRIYADRCCYLSLQMMRPFVRS